jgi:sigma-E factor negative regulatory protein RseC
MIEENAKVLSVNEGRLLVQAQPSSACGSCHARSACGQGLLSKYFNQSPGQIYIENRLPSGEALSLEPGDEIIIGIQEASVLSGAFYAYLLPLIFVVAFATLAQVLGIESEWQQILVTLTGLFFGLAFVRFILQANDKYLRNMLPILLRKAASLEKISLQQL